MVQDFLPKHSGFEYLLRDKLFLKEGSSQRDISSVGKNMGVALITTFYGSILANLFLIPIQKKLEDKHADEMLVKEIMVEGILSIQAGDNPRILEQKLYTFLSPDERPAPGGGEE